MMRGRIFVAAAAAGLAACNQAGSDNSAANATAAAAPARKHPTYCFFEDAATKGWAVSLDASGNVTVKGKAHIEDRRYSGDISQSEVTGDKASVWLTMAPNTTGMGAQDNWWDLSTTIPGSGAVQSVTLLCGKKTVAEMKVRRG
jgi:hypothetical protein